MKRYYFVGLYSNVLVMKSDVIVAHFGILLSSSFSFEFSHNTQS